MSQSQTLMQHIYYGDDKLSYQLNYIADSSAKSQIKIHILPEGMVRVDAPEHTPSKTIKDVVRKRAAWIVENLTTSQKHSDDVLEREYISGESCFYLGRRHVLKVLPVTDLPLEQQAEKAKLLRGRIALYTTNRRATRVKKILYVWYRQRALAVFKKQLAKWVETLPWLDHAPPFTVSLMDKQWGSCSAAGELSLNIHLVKAPSPCIEYIILHELCHLQQKNHSPAFYRLLDNHLPHWQGLRQQLDDLSGLLLNQ